MSGIDLEIMGPNSPENTSFIENPVGPSTCGVRVKVLTPLNRARGIPSAQTMVWGGRNSETVSLKERFGLTTGVSLICSPGAIVPSIPRTAGFQFG